jgi:hypothetical protein
LCVERAFSVPGTRLSGDRAARAADQAAQVLGGRLRDQREALLRVLLCHRVELADDDV